MIEKRFPIPNIGIVIVKVDGEDIKCDFEADKALQDKNESSNSNSKDTFGENLASFLTGNGSGIFADIPSED